jgi:hypothetical protein
MRAPEGIGVGELFGQFFDGSGARSDQWTEDVAYRSTRRRAARPLDRFRIP